MKRLQVRRLRRGHIVGLLGLLAVSACGGGDNDSPPIDPARPDARPRLDGRGGLGPDAVSPVVPPAPEVPPVPPPAGGGADAAATPPVAVDAGAPPPPPDAAPPPPPDVASPPPVDAAPPDTGPGPFVPGPSPRSIEVYDEGRIVDFYLTFAPGEFQRLSAPVGLGDARWVPCSFRFMAEPTVAAHCRRKGRMQDWPLERKPQMIVRFNFVDKAGRFRGLRRVNLESYDGAEAPVRDRLGMWLMREAGIDAPRVNHARVFKDGSYFGLYMNVESLDKEFLEDHFGPDGEGNLWESADELKTNETVNDDSKLSALDELVAREPLTGNHAAFYSALDGLMDIPQMLREMAAETVLVANDNFSNGSANFYYYEHPKRGFQVLPWDLDSIIQSAADSDPFEYWAASPPNKLRQLVNQNPGWRQQYVDNVVQIRDGIFTRMPAKLDSVCSQIREAVRTDPTRTATFEDFETDCAGVRAGIAARIAALKRMLGR